MGKEPEPQKPIEELPLKSPKLSQALPRVTPDFTTLHTHYFIYSSQLTHKIISSVSATRCVRKLRLRKASGQYSTAREGASVK